MARKNWNEFYVKCPFFRSDYKIKESDRCNCIECQGLLPGHKIINRYAGMTDYKIQLDTFCMDRFENCELYQMLEDYYMDM